MSAGLLWFYLVRGLIGLPLVGLSIVGDASMKLFETIEPYLPRRPR